MSLWQILGAQKGKAKEKLPMVDLAIVGSSSTTSKVKSFQGPLSLPRGEENVGTIQPLNMVGPQARGDSSCTMADHLRDLFTSVGCLFGLASTFLSFGFGFL